MTLQKIDSFVSNKEQLIKSTKDPDLKKRLIEELKKFKESLKVEDIEDFKEELYINKYINETAKSSLHSMIDKGEKDCTKLNDAYYQLYMSETKLASMKQKVDIRTSGIDRLVQAFLSDKKKK